MLIGFMGLHTENGGIALTVIKITVSGGIGNRE
jgi:hypothetical protein